MKPKSQDKNSKKNARENEPTPSGSQQSYWPRSGGVLKAKDMNARQKIDKSLVENDVKEASKSKPMPKYLANNMYERQKAAYYSDRNRLAQLMAIINADPPPPWDDASIMWLEVDKLENRIEEFEKSNKRT